MRYFDRNVYVADLDVARVQGLVDWLTSHPGRAGRLSDRSIANVLTPLRAVLDAATAEGWLDKNPAAAVVLPRRRRGRSWSAKEARYLTRAELARLLEEIPEKWKPLFDLLAATGLRIAEAIALRWSDLELDSGPPRLRARPGAPADPGSLRRRILVPAAERAGLSGVGFHALTIEAYGHLLDGDLGPALDLSTEL